MSSAEILHDINRIYLSIKDYIVCDMDHMNLKLTRTPSTHES